MKCLVCFFLSLIWISSFAIQASVMGQSSAGSTGKQDQQAPHIPDKTQLSPRPFLCIIENRATAGVVEIPVKDFDGHSSEEGTLACQGAVQGSASQHWLLSPLGGGFFQIENRATAKLLSASPFPGPLLPWEDCTWGESVPKVRFGMGEIRDYLKKPTGLADAKKNARCVVQWTRLDSDIQAWRITPLDNGFFRIENKVTGTVLKAGGARDKKAGGARDKEEKSLQTPQTPMEIWRALVPPEPKRSIDETMVWFKWTDPSNKVFLSASDGGPAEQWIIKQLH